MALQTTLAVKGRVRGGADCDLRLSRENFRGEQSTTNQGEADQNQESHANGLQQSFHDTSQDWAVF